MAELDDQIKNILSDEESMKKVMEMARSIMASDRAPEEPVQRTPQPSAGAVPDIMGGLGGLSMLPEIMQALSGDKTYIDENKLNLIKAIKPYMASERAGEIDRAIKMANTAKAAKNILGMINRK